jgi:ABC-2 type transport system ATP-binding protein
MSMPLFQIDSVTKIYKRGLFEKNVAAVRELSFSVPADRITGFVGPNGAGKTTTLKMIMGLVAPTRGTIRINGRDASCPQSRAGIAFLSEQPYFYEHLTVEESLRFAGALLSLPNAMLRNDIGRVLEMVQLADQRGKKVKALSKGMQQRLNLAQSLLGNPSALVLDEPMSGLDPPGRRLFRTIFRDLADRGAGIFFSTHILDDIESLCHGVVVLSRGIVRYQGAITSLLEQGELGADITVRGLSADSADRLRALGCTVTEPWPGTNAIFVPRDCNRDECQRLLREQQVVFESIQPRRQSLESILYTDTREETA